MEIDEALDQSEQLWIDAVSAVAPGDFDKPSGCDGWTITDLVNHVAGGGHRYAMLLDGADAAATALTRNNDYIGSDAVAQFWRYEQMLRDVAAVADLGAMVDHRAGPRSGTTLLNVRVMDLTLHASRVLPSAGSRIDHRRTSVAGPVRPSRNASFCCPR